MRRSRPFAVVIGASLVFAACSSDDGAGDTSAPTTIAPDSTTRASATVTTSPVSPTAPTTTSVASTTSITTAATTVPSTSEPPTSTSATTIPAADTTQEPTPSRLLSQQLPDAAELGIPAGWLPRTVSADLEDVPVDEVDPFEGLLTCDGGPVVPTDAEVWVEHRFTGTSPTNEMISVSIVAVVEDDGSAADRAARLATCEATSPATIVERSTQSGADGPDVAVTEVFSSATGSLPFAAAIAHAVARKNGHTVSVTVLGLNNGLGFAEQARAHLRTVLATL